MSVFQAASPKLANMLKATASTDEVIRSKALTEFYDVLGPLIRDGVQVGDITGGIFTEVNLPPGVTPEFRLSPIRPGTENEYRAYTNPGMGHIPERTFFGDKIILPTIDVTNSQSWPLKYAREARWDVVAKALEVFMAGFVYKKNDDCWHTILKAAADRGMTLYDAAAQSGQFTKRLFSQVDIAMKRNGGGNSASLRRGKATNIYVSPEAIQEVLNWNVDQIPDVVRAQFYSMSGSDNPTMDILGVKLHELYELGAGQVYQTYYTSTLGANLVPIIADGVHAVADVELGIAVDLMNRDSFILANTHPLEVHEDPYLHRAQMGGVYGFSSYGIGCLDSRRLLALSF
jgi:hypothetical protein